MPSTLHIIPYAYRYLHLIMREKSLKCLITHRSTLKKYCDRGLKWVFEHTHNKNIINVCFHGFYAHFYHPRV